MCGITGAIYRKPAEEDGWTPNEAAEILLTSSVHRGHDATGWMYEVPGEDVVTYCKMPDAAWDATKHLEIADNSPWWYGHVRFATVGTPANKLNNHPILHHNIMGVHNGTIANYEEVLQEAGGRMDPKAEVDSEAIFAAINKFGIFEGLPKLYGGAAIAFVDLRDTSVQYLARVRNYPLVIAKAPGTGNLYFASERAILDQLCIKWDKVWHVKEGRVVTIKNGRIQDWKKLRLPALPQDYGMSGMMARWRRNTTPTTTKSKDEIEAELDSGALGFLDWVTEKISEASDRVIKWYDGELMTELEYYTQLLDEYYQSDEYYAQEYPGLYAKMMGLEEDDDSSSGSVDDGEHQDRVNMAFRQAWGDDAEVSAENAAMDQHDADLRAAEAADRDRMITESALASVGAQLDDPEIVAADA